MPVECLCPDAHAFEQMAMDDALALLDVVMTAIVHDAQHHGEKARLAPMACFRYYDHDHSPYKPGSTA